MLAQDYLTKINNKFLPIDFNNNFPELSDKFYISGKVYVKVSGLPEDNEIINIKFYLE